MLNVYNYKNNASMLNKFLDTVENDVSSILYHTRVFDNFMINGILDYYNSNTINVIPHYLFCNEFELITYYAGNSSFFFILYKDIILELLDIDSLFFSNNNFSFINDIFLGIFLFFIEYDFNYFYTTNLIFFLQKNEIFNITCNTIELFSDFLFFFDFFLIFAELLLFLFLFLLLFNKVSNFFITTKFYDNILNFFKYNSISLLEISITCTLFISFYVFDIFLSFSEDDFSDTFFYTILLFIFLMFFFLSIAIDIQYFYSMSNTSNGDISIRLLFFDILNNFLGILRIFLC